MSRETRVVERKIPSVVRATLPVAPLGSNRDGATVRGNVTERDDGAG